MNHIVKSFISGANLLVILPFYIRVMNISDSIKNYSFNLYAIIAPLYFGIMNIIKNYYEIHPILFGIISATIVFFFAKFTKSYNYITNKEYMFYYFRILISHIFAYTVSINLIEKII